ncbi:MAG: MaoC family dehydratase [Caldimonas sp.]
MSPPGRPKGEFRSAQHEGTPESKRSPAGHAGEAPAFVGESFTMRVRLTNAEIPAFAALVHDHNPLHHDLAAALAAGYRGLIASGTQIGAIFMAMTATHFSQPGGHGQARSGVGLGFEIRFRAPVYANEDIELRWVVTGIERKDKLAGWIARLEGEVRSGDTPLLSGTGTLLLRLPETTR